jgi:hypothetical protein
MHAWHVSLAARGSIGLDFDDPIISSPHPY